MQCQGGLMSYGTQKNAWIHTAATIFVIAFAIWLRLPAQDWALLLITIAIVWAAEFLNTALEIVVDLASLNYIQWLKLEKMLALQLS